MGQLTALPQLYLGGLLLKKGERRGRQGRGRAEEGRGEAGRGGDERGGEGVRPLS